MADQLGSYNYLTAGLRNLPTKAPIRPFYALKCGILTEPKYQKVKPVSTKLASQVGRQLGIPVSSFLNAEHFDS